MKRSIVAIFVLLVVLTGSVFAGTTSERRAEAVVDYLDYVIGLWEVVPASMGEELAVAVSETEVLFDMIDDWDSIYEQEREDYVAGGDWVPDISSFGGGYLTHAKDLFRKIKAEYTSFVRAKESGDAEGYLVHLFEAQMLGAWGNTLQWGNSPSDPYKGYEILDFLNPDGAELPSKYENYGMVERLESTLVYCQSYVLPAFFEQEEPEHDTGGGSMSFELPRLDAINPWWGEENRSDYVSRYDMDRNITLKLLGKADSEDIDVSFSNLLEEEGYVEITSRITDLDTSYDYAGAFIVEEYIYSYNEMESLSERARLHVVFLNDGYLYHLSGFGFNAMPPLTEEMLIKTAESVKLP